MTAVCYLLTGCSSRSWQTARNNHSNSPSRSCTAAESASHKSQIHISPGSSILAQALDSSARLTLYLQSPGEKKPATVRVVEASSSWQSREMWPADGGQCAVTTVLLLTTGLYVGDRSILDREPRDRHPLACQSERADRNMAHPACTNQ